jgi:hypothetical protein
MVWECRSLCAKESGQTEATNPILKSMELTDSTDSEAYSQRIDLDRLWLSSVQEYTDRDLTFTKDKLPAISGVAKFFQSKHESDYLAGLWKHDIARELLWTRNSRTSLERVFPLRAPTWSWAAYDGQISWDWSLHGHTQLQCAGLSFRINQACVQERLPGSCGAVVQGGYLEAQGLLYEATFEGNKPGYIKGFLRTEFGYTQRTA